MEWHIRCDAKDISQYVFCPGDQARARKIADRFENPYLVSETRGILVMSGHYQGTFMTVCGTGMGGPVVAIALEELAHMGANTFIRVGSCGVFQEGQKPGDVIIASGTFRAGGTGNAYLPLPYPAVPTFSILRALVESAEKLKIAHVVGVGIAGDAFYAPREPNSGDNLRKMGLVSVEMESDTLFIIGAHHSWRTGALYASDGAPGVIKPESDEANYRRGEQECISIALDAMKHIADADG